MSSVVPLRKGYYEDQMKIITGVLTTNRSLSGCICSALTVYRLLSECHQWCPYNQSVTLRVLPVVPLRPIGYYQYVITGVLTTNWLLSGYHLWCPYDTPFIVRVSSLRPIGYHEDIITGVPPYDQSAIARV